MFTRTHWAQNNPGKSLIITPKHTLQCGEHILKLFRTLKIIRSGRESSGSYIYYSFPVYISHSFNINI